MDNTEKEKFESLWKDFVILIKGKLITTSKKQTLSTPLANLILSETSASWGSNYTVNGRWLNSLRETSPEKAEIVYNILLNDLKFSGNVVDKTMKPYWDYVIPSSGACAGLAMSVYMECSKFTQAASFILPAVLLYPAVKSFRKNQLEEQINKTIKSYIVQLDKYKDSVISVLS